MSLLKGTLDVVVLKALTLGPMHPFEITRWIEERSGGELEVEGGALFQAMHRLDARGEHQERKGDRLDDRGERKQEKGARKTNRARKP